MPSRRGQVVLGLLIAVVAAYGLARVASWMAWRQRETAFFVAAPYVRVYVRTADAPPADAGPGAAPAFGAFQEVKLTDRAAIERIWKAMDYFRRQPAAPIPKSDRLDGTNACVAALCYPVERGHSVTATATAAAADPAAPEAETDPDRTALEYPILIFADGRSTWGENPDKRPDCFNTPALRDAVFETGRAAASGAATP
jgi:hypothetical protein